MAKRWSKSNSLRRIVSLAGAGLNAPLLLDEPLRYAKKNITWRYWPPGAEKTQNNTRLSMPGEPI
jgi:hypothetical protein